MWIWSGLGSGMSVSGWGARLECADARLVADPSGALVWPERATLVVADLHLEKGSSFARHGALLPPYDTAATLARLEEVLARWRPRRVISLGDGFHDGQAASRLCPGSRARLRDLVHAHDWLWVTGNHDPDPPEGLGGRSEGEVAIGRLTFRHLPRGAPQDGEVAGHLHPKARLSVRGRRLSRPCFASDDGRVVMPAFGAYAGGLDVRDPAIAGLFAFGCTIRMLGRRAVHRIAAVTPPASPRLP
jgi:uncharacterized protein